jgi:hypothetical protein
MAGETRVLIITYLFPPSGGVGVPRFVSYARYLPELNCNVSVLTASNPSTPVYDPELAKQIPPATKVFRAFNPELPYDLRDRIWKSIHSTKSNAMVMDSHRPSRLKTLAREIIQRICFPDAQAGWVPFAVRAAKRIINRERIDTVLLNAPPFSCLGIAVALRKTFPRLKLIIDFRDEWISNYMGDFDVKRTRRERGKALKLERAAIEASDFVSGITPAQTQQIRARYPNQADSKFICVPNGYDPELFSNFRPRPNSDQKMVITYLGTVYANRVYAPLWRYLDVIEQLPDDVRDRIETRFVGRVAREAAPLFEKYTSNIKLLGFFPRAEAVRFLEETDCQLMVSSNPTSHGGKLFDYMASGRPILALAPPDGEIGRIMTETRAGWCVDPNDEQGIRDMLMCAFEIKRGNAVFAPDHDAIKAYEWPGLVARMARLTGMSTRRG